MIVNIRIYSFDAWDIQSNEIVERMPHIYPAQFSGNYSKYIYSKKSNILRVIADSEP